MKVLWWNIFGPHPLLDQNETYKNILELSKFHEYLFLGEYDPNLFSKNKKNELLKTHPNFLFFKHKKRPDGIAVFSKTPIEISKTYYQSTESFYLETTLKNKNILITHLRHNWHTLKEKEGLIGVIKIFFGNMTKNNSLINKQCEELLPIIKHKDIIFGDMNTFPSFFGINSSLYRAFKKIGFNHKINKKTWPNPKVDFLKYPSLILDQVFVKNSDCSAKVLDLDGSDHLPLSINIKPQ